MEDDVNTRTPHAFCTRTIRSNMMRNFQRADDIPGQTVHGLHAISSLFATQVIFRNERSSGHVAIINICSISLIAHALNPTLAPNPHSSFPHSLYHLLQHPPYPTFTIYSINQPNPLTYQPTGKSKTALPASHLRSTIKAHLALAVDGSVLLLFAVSAIGSSGRGPRGNPGLRECYRGDLCE